MIIKFFLFRHGETDWNLNRRFQGHSDIALNATGEAQALELAEKLKQLRLKFLLSSDLIRAVRTAEIATSGLNLSMILNSGLRETHLGQAEGLTVDEINQKFSGGLLEKWSAHESLSADFGFPDGETKKQHLVRLKKTLESFADENSHQLKNMDEIGVSTHGGCLIRLIHSCEGAPSERIPIPNCSLYEVHYNFHQKSWHYIRMV